MNTRFLLSLFCSVACMSLLAHAESAEVGKKAPDFTLMGADGKQHSLSEYAGKYVVLEWTNPDCPFVKKFYNTNTMQTMQAKDTAKGVVWLRINSGAPDHEGYQSPAQMAAYVAKHHVHATASLVDSSGKVGHMYGARNTPQMFVINPQGDLIYAGGIDNKPTTDTADLATATNYVKAALKESMAGEPVKTPTAAPYGCSVKYAE